MKLTSKDHSGACPQGLVACALEIAWVKDLDPKPSYSNPSVAPSHVDGQHWKLPGRRDPGGLGEDHVVMQPQVIAKPGANHIHGM